MTLRQGSWECSSEEVIWKKLLTQCLVAGLLLALGPVAPAVSQSLWTGDGADNLWSNPDNWDLGEPPFPGDETKVNGPEAAAPNGPVIEEGIEAFAGVLVADVGSPAMSMTGGSLELTGWGMWWGDAAGTTATFDMSGGIIDFTGSPGIMELGWQEETDPAGS